MKHTLAALAALAALALFCGLAEAKYPMPDLEKVPVARLIANLEAKLGKSPKDASLLNDLARVHAMAYAKALGTDAAVDVRKGDTGPWFGRHAPHVPYARLKTKAATDEAAAAAKAELKKAGR